MGRFIDMTGERYGRLVVLRRADDYIVPKTGKHQTMWECVCDCGRNVVTARTPLVSGAVISCGCAGRENRMRAIVKHGGTGSRLYNIWLDMRHRCTIPGSTRYDNYGGRGINVCEEWNDFATFRFWAESSGYNDTLSIDRVDVNGDYCPENCRWTDILSQNNNTTRNVKIALGGEEMTIGQWARRLGISYNTMYGRIKLGWPEDRLLLGSSAAKE